MLFAFSAWLEAGGAFSSSASKRSCQRKALRSLIAKRPRRRLVDKCAEGEERRKDDKEAKVAKREEEDCGRKM